MNADATLKAVPMEKGERIAIAKLLRYSADNHNSKMCLCGNHMRNLAEQFENHEFIRIDEVE